MLTPKVQLLPDRQMSALPPKTDIRLTGRRGYVRRGRPFLKRHTARIPAFMWI